jgi:hypothetical protein
MERKSPSARRHDHRIHAVQGSRFGVEDRCEPNASGIDDAARFAFFQETQIWYTRRGSGVPSRLENIIVLSKEFYEEVLAHPIPTDLDAVRVLSGAPAVLYWPIHVALVSLLYVKKRVGFCAIGGPTATK